MADPRDLEIKATNSAQTEAQPCRNAISTQSTHETSSTTQGQSKRGLLDLPVELKNKVGLAIEQTQDCTHTSQIYGEVIRTHNASIQTPGRVTTMTLNGVRYYDGMQTHPNH